jgi:perosamine synthetase
MDRIPVSGPWITQKEVDLVAEAAARGWYGNANLYQSRFEAAFAAYTGRRFAVTLPSCTSGLHLALLAAGVKPGDEVIVPDVTWIASVAPVTYVGAVPVFADIDPSSWCMDARSAESLVTPRTRAILPVDLYGDMPDYDALRALADRRGLALIEDAAEAVGSRWKGRLAGGFGRASAFSFHGSKTLTTGEGGMLLSDDEAFHQRCLFLRDHGRPPGDIHFRNTEVAFKYKMSAMQAALGLAQLERVEELIARKREIFGWYRDALAGVEGITLNRTCADVHHTYWMVTVVLDPRCALRKEEVMAGLAEAGIDSRPFFHPLSSLEAYAGQPQAEAAKARNRVAYDVSPRGVNLPSGLNLTPELVRRVAERLKTLLAGKR